MKLLVYIRTVLWSFIGIGSRARNSEDLRTVNPLGLLGVAAVLVAAFVLTIYGLVHLAVGTLK
ncbi:MAG: hypothetical protein JWP22_2263 [Ramlibacter sp.]|jgi:hypothetical protein|nr:hypothetical protein [Ramlibacter sp.]MDB5913588.1 hypothetical protein [Ramlibacter sp.]